MAGYYGNKEKAEHAFRAFGKDIKGIEFEGAVLLFGVEEYLIKWAVDSLVKRYLTSGAEVVDFVKLDDDNATVSDIIDACGTFSMFSEKRVVWMRESTLIRSKSPRGYSSDDIKRLIEYLENPNPGTLLIFSATEPEMKADVTAFLNKNYPSYNFSTLEKRDLEGFIVKRLKDSGLMFDRGIVDYIIDESGYLHKDSKYRIYNMENDLMKMIAHSDGMAVTYEDVSLTLNGNMDSYVFNMLDAVCANRKDQAFMYLRNMMADGGSTFQIAALLIGQFELMLECKEFREEGLNPAQMAKALKMHEFRVKKAAGYADRISKDRLKTTLCKLYDIDKNIKSGDIPEDVSLELIIAGI